jgi:glycosyltransferase involved in cell wall biosynthesis
VTRLSIIIPVYNEERTVFQVLEKVHQVVLPDGVDKEIVVVNDASRDGSGLELDRYVSAFPERAIQIVTHTVNQGKGAGIRTGLQHVSGDYVIIQDADLELNPDEIALLLEPVLRNEADVVYGSRFKGKKASGSALSRLANRFLTALSNLVFRIRITDMETCYKLMPASLAGKLVLKEDRFGFEPEITAKLAKVRSLRWKEVSISYQPRTGVQGKKIGWKDGFRAMWCIIHYGWLTSKKKSFRS